MVLKPLKIRPPWYVLLETTRTHLRLLILLHYVTKRQTPPAPLMEIPQSSMYNDLQRHPRVFHMWPVLGVASQ